MHKFMKIFVPIVLLCASKITADLETTFARCCSLGANWARKEEICSNFLIPVENEAPEYMPACLTAASICCLRFYREEQCEIGKRNAKEATNCSVSDSIGGEYAKDCCDGCKLGIISGNNGAKCLMKDFNFGFPWNEAYLECCLETTTNISANSIDMADQHNLNNAGSPLIDLDIPDSENLCLRFSGQLCSHICVATKESYVCKCRNGFSLSPDKKSCIQEAPEDRCETHNPCDHLCRDTGISIECSCRKGFELSTDQKTCEDINECITSKHNCTTNTEICVNSMGSYACLKKEYRPCDFGYRFHKNLATCVDIDECKEGIHLCTNSKEECENLDGAYKCNKIIYSSTITQVGTMVSTTASSVSPCEKGYLYNNATKMCTDINECQENPCSVNEICINLDLSFECECKDGFGRDNVLNSCQDLNECQLGLHTCAPSQRCDNTLGSYTCTRIASCGTGYTLNQNTGKCEDNNECMLKTNDCAQLGSKWTCVNTKGSFRCEKKQCKGNKILNSWGNCVNVSCTIGFTPQNKICVDLNECEVNEYPCKSNEKCINTVGSYRCAPKIHCGRGYKMNQIGTQCIDMDECKDGTHKCEGGQLCINRPGGYICQCPKGFRLDRNRNCHDVNECEEYYQSICGYNADCSNSPGSYECTCKSGFEKTTDGSACTDINECTTVQNICQHKCTNVWGSHFCSCNAGYKLRSDNRTCSDIDECEEMKGKGKLCLGLCVNTPGTYRCSCPQGYRLDSDKRTCKDVNECNGVAVCRIPDEICVNTRGSHKCKEILCPDKYVRDPTQRNRCKKQIICKDDDFECRQLPLMYSYSFLPLASNMTLRRHKEIELFTMRGPIWSSANVEFELELDTAMSEEDVPHATKSHFKLNRTAFNQVVLVLVKSIVGPQEVILSLNMKLYHNGFYEGSAISKLAIYVSQHDF